MDLTKFTVNVEVKFITDTTVAIITNGKLSSIFGLVESE